MTEKKISQNSEKKSSSIRFGLKLEEIRQAYLDNLLCIQGRLIEGMATRNDIFMALAYTVRDRLLKMEEVESRLLGKTKAKAVSYLSAEFLLGPQLRNNMINLGIFDDIVAALNNPALNAKRYNLEDILDQEQEPGLGNGGLGRLAACYLDSLASLEVMAVGYGIRYEFGLFDQKIQDGWQVEITDKWLQYGNPWEIARPEISFEIKFGGQVSHGLDEKGGHAVKWIPERQVKGVAYDTWIPGYRVNNSSLLRLWKAEATESFDFQAFNHGDYYKAVEDKVYSENISKVLYPNDEQFAGKQLRLEQQYFFVSASLQDMIRLFLLLGKPLEKFHELWATQLNDTHPSIAVAELMRLLVDEHHLEWEVAWHVTRQTFSYTNHTLLPEALEKWPISLLGRLLPRHLEIIYEINRRFLAELRKVYPGDEARIGRMSLIDESGERYVRMAHLACVGSHKVNGVAQLHSELLKNDLLRDFNELGPEKFLNITNGVTPRRWMVLSNPGISRLISETVGPDWVMGMEKLRGLEDYAEDPAFQAKWREIKRTNKSRLADLILKSTNIKVEADSLFDVQTKRIHEYKRQHLNVLHIVTLYNRLKENPGLDIPPRTFIFGGKAAPGYFMAKLILKLINSVAEVVNTDRDSRDKLRVVFFPDFNVKNGHRIYPAADLSEQISTAGKEASGTGNMKFSMNGALTIGTLDGANIEIRQEVGPENFFLFGLTAQAVKVLSEKGYRPREYYQSNLELKQAIDLIDSGYFCPGDPELFRPLTDSLKNSDPYMLLADYQSYIDCQDSVGRAYQDQSRWTQMSIINVARIGKFSSDRAIREYCDIIWGIKTKAIVS